MTSERHVSYKSIYKSEKKSLFFLNQFSKFRASDNSDLQIKRLLQNKTTDYNNCIYIKTILFSAKLLNHDTDQLPILLSVPPSLVFCPNEHSPTFNFLKARWDDFASYFDSHCPSAEGYLSLSLSSAATLFTSLALNAAKSSIPFGGIKRHPKA